MPNIGISMPIIGIFVILEQCHRVRELFGMERQANTCFLVIFHRIQYFEELSGTIGLKLPSIDGD